MALLLRRRNRVYGFTKLYDPKVPLAASLPAMNYDRD